MINRTITIGYTRTNPKRFLRIDLPCFDKTENDGPEKDMMDLFQFVFVSDGNWQGKMSYYRLQNGDIVKFEDNKQIYMFVENVDGKFNFLNVTKEYEV